MSSSMTGKVALVTGAGSGIGRASARAFGREGAKVVVADVNVDGGRETVRLIEEAGGEASFVTADVTNPTEVEELVSGVIESYGALDCAHNNAGVGGPAAETHLYPEEDWDRVLAVNLTGVWYSMRAEITAMRKQGSGAIVNTSSTFGLVAVPNCSAYIASKHAVAGLTKAAALENARNGIRINAVCPGAIDTPMLGRFFDEINPDDPQQVESGFAEQEPMGRLGQPEEIGEAVLWLCSDAASFVTGTPLLVDGGWVAQ